MIKLKDIVKEIKARTGKLPKYKIGDTFKAHDGGIYKIVDIYTNDEAIQNAEFLKNQEPDAIDWYPERTEDFWYVIKSEDGSYIEFITHSTLDMPDIFTLINREVNEIKARLLKFPKFKVGDELYYTYKNGKKGHVFIIKDVLTYEEAKQHPEWAHGTALDKNTEIGPGKFWYYGEANGDGDIQFSTFNSEFILTKTFTKLIDEVKARQPISLDFNNAKIVKVKSLNNTDFWEPNTHMELIDLGSYYTFIPWPDMTAFYLVNKQNFIVEPNYHETSQIYHDNIIEVSIKFLKDFKGKKEIIK